MDYDIIICWLVCFSCLTGLAIALTRLRASARGWVVVFLLILAVCITGYLREQSGLIYAGGSLWLLLVLLPGFLTNVHFRWFLQQRYAEARRLARIISWLHPADGWRQQPRIIHAIELAQRGELSSAVEALKRYEGGQSLVALAAIPTLCRITGQWENLLAWELRHRRELEGIAQLLHARLRARGEIGDLCGLVWLYEQHKRQISNLTPVASRDLCRLMLFAFCGKRNLAEGVLAGSLAILPSSTREFWLATANLAAGQRETASRQLEALREGAEPSLRVAIERRLAQSATPREPLSAAAEAVIENAALEQSHEERFGAQPTLFSNRARATQILILLNLLMFGAELLLGGATQPQALYRLGALVPPAVRAGQWWRLVASLFLHVGTLHLAMNMAGLWLLGPFVELALGFRRFLLVYLLAGIGSMAVVMAFASGPHGEQMTVGASGCVMGLIGATGALMLRGWLQAKASSARRRLATIFMIVAMQTAFDALVPHVSMTGHLSGTVIGFAAAMGLRDRLEPQTEGTERVKGREGL